MPWSTFKLREARKTLGDLEERYGLLRVGKFGFATFLGFLVTEAILTVGVIVLYHTTAVPRIAFSSSGILGLDFIAFFFGVTVAFLLNERFTVQSSGAKGVANLVTRLMRYQLAALLGNLVVVGVQLALLAELSVSPVLGSVIGALVSYPLTYFVSIRFVWRIRPGS